MTPRISVSAEVESRLDGQKRENETYDELLARLADRNSPLEAGAWEGTDRARAAREASGRVRDDFE